MKQSYHRRVQAEVDEAVDWYEEQSTGLGDDFYAKLKEALAQIEARPESFSFLAGLEIHSPGEAETIPLRCAL